MTEMDKNGNIKNNIEKEHDVKISETNDAALDEVNEKISQLIVDEIPTLCKACKREIDVDNENEEDSNVAGTFLNVQVYHRIL